MHLKLVSTNSLFIKFKSIKCCRCWESGKWINPYDTIPLKAWQWRIIKRNFKKPVILDKCSNKYSYGQTMRKTRLHLSLSAYMYKPLSFESVASKTRFPRWGGVRKMILVTIDWQHRRSLLSNDYENHVIF